MNVSLEDVGKLFLYSMGTALVITVFSWYIIH
jgi:hypothetical protein